MTVATKIGIKEYTGTIRQRIQPILTFPESKDSGILASTTSFLRSTPVGAEQTSTGCFAPYYLHKRICSGSPNLTITIYYFTKQSETRQNCQLSCLT